MLKIGIIVVALVSLCRGTQPPTLDPLRYGLLDTSPMGEYSTAILPSTPLSNYYDASVSSYHLPSSVLTPDVFNSYIFTTGPVVPYLTSMRILGGTQQDFIVAQVEANNRKIKMYAVQVAGANQQGEKGYWIPQGGYVDIPLIPGVDQPKYAFTADFSGCSLTITRMGAHYRVRHVEGGQENSQFNYLSDAEKGLGDSYAMQPKDYAYYSQAPGSRRKVKNIKGFAYMHFDQVVGEWRLVFQRQMQPQSLGQFRFDRKGRLSSAILTQPNQQGIPLTFVAGTKEFGIPLPFLNKGHRRTRPNNNNRKYF